MKRWAIYIDVEGFSKLHSTDECRALRVLGALMEGIYYIGSTACAETPNRLFAHQTGDGFVIVSEFAEGRPTLPVAICIVLMRLAVREGGMAKAGISEGHFADIQGCYPKIIRDNSDGDGFVRLGDGLMRIFPVMGTALINAHRLTSRKRGSLLLLDSQMATDLPSNVVVTEKLHGCVCVDWIHSNPTEIYDLLSTASICLPDQQSLEKSVLEYIRQSDASLPNDWIKNTLELNQCEATDAD